MKLKNVLAGLILFAPAAFPISALAQESCNNFMEEFSTTLPSQLTTTVSEGNLVETKDGVLVSTISKVNTANKLNFSQRVVGENAEVRVDLSDFVANTAGNRIADAGLDFDSSSSSFRLRMEKSSTGPAKFYMTAFGNSAVNIFPGVTYFANDEKVVTFVITKVGSLVTGSVKVGDTYTVLGTAFTDSKSFKVALAHYVGNTEEQVSIATFDNFSVKCSAETESGSLVNSLITNYDKTLKTTPTVQTEGVVWAALIVALALGTTAVYLSLKKRG